jgi:hypothetical protein
LLRENDLESMAVMDSSESKNVRRKKRLSPIAGKLLLAGAAILGSLVICELVLRVMFIGFQVYMWTHPVRGVGHIPGMKSLRQHEGRPWIEINSDGWRGPETSLQPPPGTLRIALLGDSFIEAFEVPFEQTVGEVIERQLSPLLKRPVEVLNFGNGGYGTSQELLTLQHEVWKYSPDLVLLAITTGNDISDNYRPLKRLDYVPYHVLQSSELVLDSSFLQSRGYQRRAFWTHTLQPLIKHLRVAQVINRVRHVRRRDVRKERNAEGTAMEEEGLSNDVQLPPTTPEWHEAWRVTEAILRAMRDECRRKNTPFAMVTLTRGIQVSVSQEKKEAFLRQLGVKDLYYPERRLEAFGKREGIPVLTLAPTMAEMALKRQVYYHSGHGVLGTGHWTKEGHQAAGELISSWLAGTLADEWRETPRRPMTAR